MKEPELNGGMQSSYLMHFNFSGMKF